MAGTDPRIKSGDGHDEQRAGGSTPLTRPPSRERVRALAHAAHGPAQPPPVAGVRARTDTRLAVRLHGGSVNLPIWGGGGCPMFDAFDLAIALGVCALYTIGSLWLIHLGRDWG